MKDISAKTADSSQVSVSFSHSWKYGRSGEKIAWLFEVHSKTPWFGVLADIELVEMDDDTVGELLCYLLNPLSENYKPVFKVEVFLSSTFLLFCYGYHAKAFQSICYFDKGNLVWRPNATDLANYHLLHDFSLTLFFHNYKW